MNLLNDIEIRAKEELFINLNPIQSGGRLTPEAMKTIIAYGDGYSVCDYCRAPFRLDKIRRPPIQDFHRELAKFLGMDEARVVPGARRGFQAVVSSLVKKGDSVILSGIAHYTEYLAIESVGGVVKEIPLNHDNIITKEATEKKIEAVQRETGSIPKLVMLDHFDYMFGNEHDVYGVSKVAKQYDIPFLYNGAYSIGILPVNGLKIGADFLVGSGHKSFASPAPSGILATTEEWSTKVFKTTNIVGDVTNRSFGIKEVELLGCTLMGSNLVAMMASFPKIEERVGCWDEELKKINYFVNEFLKIEGNMISSELPRKHTLTNVDTTKSYDVVADTHRRRGFFLSDELKERRIVGEFPGATKHWKLNTYGLNWSQIKHLAGAFQEIAEKYGIKIS